MGFIKQRGLGSFLREGDYLTKAAHDSVLAVRHVDYNQNRKLDRVARPGQRKEEILSDFLHTTPADELAYKLSRQIPNQYKVNLLESHGCVHMDPAAMCQLVARGATGGG